MKAGSKSTQERLREGRRRVALIRRAVAIIWSAAGKWTLLWAAILIAEGLIPAGLVYMTKYLVNAVADVVGTGAHWENVRMVLWPAGIMAGLFVLQRVLSSFGGWVAAAQSELVQDRIKEHLHVKATSVAYAFYETPAYFDRLQQANSQSSTRILGLLQNAGNLLQSAVTFVSIAAILAQYSLFIPLLLLLSTLPAFSVVITHNRRFHSWWEERTALQRWTQYFDSLLTHHLSAAEIRQLSIGGLFRQRYQALRRRLVREQLALARNQALASLAAAGFALLVTGATMAWMVWRSLQGMARLGDLALFYQAFNQGQGLMRNLLTGMGQIYADTLFLDHLFHFLDQEDEDVHDVLPAVPFPQRLQQGIEFQNVGFTYPGTDRPALHELDLFIPAGKTVAIVGANGAGKSTVAKLLSRFYEPQEGGITIDGADVRDFSRSDLRSNISVMFQYPVRYQASVGENIGFGTEDAAPADIERAAQGSGADAFIERLPRGYETQLGRLFEGGVELSGGEWQRIALSRAFLRQAPIVVLDEPTSYMDSWAETSWLRRFKRLVQDRTAIVITHRFTTAMQADIIYVMMGGTVVEAGTHAELLARGGRYAASWRAQMQVEHGGLPDDEAVSPLADVRGDGLALDSPLHDVSAVLPGGRSA